MAMVFPEYALYPHLNLYRNIAFALKPTVKSRPILINGSARRCRAAADALPPVGAVRT